jgi:predicted MFS family arabinose efflux permease
VTQLSFLPTLISREKLLEGNSKLQATSSAAAIAGPGLAGVLVQLLTAPVAIIVDSCSFLVSAFCVWRIRADEPPPAGPDARQNVWAEMREGVSTVYRSPILRPLAEGVAAHFMFSSMIYSILILYLTNELGVEPALLGLIFAAFGPGLLLGALVAGRAALRFGPGPAMLGATLLNGVAGTIIAAAQGPRPVVVALLMAAHFLLGAGIQVHGINLVSLRQAMTADRMQGRVNACFRFNNLCAITAGALLAGTLGELVGLRATLAVAGAGLYLPFLRLLFSPARALREQPAGVD